MRKFFGLAALAAASVFVALPTPASAGWNFGWYGGWSPRFSSTYPHYYRYGWGPRYYYGNYYPYATYYQLNAPAETSTATIRMRLPSDAQVWFDGEATSQKGTLREFTTPALTPGAEYVYHVRVQWYESGKPMEQKSDIKLHAGDMVNFALSK
jgi:uncharacterized protein (TIGR03000 family)